MAVAWKPDYVTSAQLKTYLRINDTDDDALIADAITSSSRAIDRFCNRQFGQEASAIARYYTAEWNRVLRRWVIEIDDLMTTTGLLVNADLADDANYAYPVTEFALRPVNADKDGVPWTKIVVHPTSTNLPDARDGAVEVTARYGWLTVPVGVQSACKLQAGRFFKRRGALFGVAGSPEMGNELRLLSKLDPDVEVMLADGGFRRVWGAA